jgi:hypothetical protein
MTITTIKTPRSKQAFREMVSNLAPFESINWQHHDDWYGVIDVTLKVEYKFGSARAVITLRYSSGTEGSFDYQDVDSVVIHLWKYRGGMTQTGTFNRNLLEQAERIEELKLSLENIAFDDGKELSDLTEDEIIEQATYMLSMFNEEGTMQYEALCDGDADMRWQWHELQRFVKRYDYPERPKNLYERLNSQPVEDEETLEQLAEEAVKMRVFGLLEQEDGYERLSDNECRLPMTDGSKYKVRVLRDRIEVVFAHPYTGDDRVHEFTHRKGVEYIEHRSKHYYQRAES